MNPIDAIIEIREECSSIKSHLGIKPHVPLDVFINDIPSHIAMEIIGITTPTQNDHYMYNKFLGLNIIAVGYDFLEPTTAYDDKICIPLTIELSDATIVGMYIYLDDTVDKDTLLNNLKGKIVSIDKDILILEKIMSKKGFLDNAPDEVVSEKKSALKSLNIKKSSINNIINALIQPHNIIRKGWDDTLGNYVVDQFDNKISVLCITYKEAINKLLTLKDCTNCVNCVYCTGCHNCVDCYHCVDCVDCTSCMFCTEVSSGKNSCSCNKLNDIDNMVFNLKEGTRNE